MAGAYGVKHTSVPFNEEEVIAAINQLKKRKTPGIDEIQRCYTF